MEQVDSPKVSVIMPVYNAEFYLSEAIDSILNQSFKDFEFIIIDDGSVDKSLTIIKSYKDARIKIVTNEQNMGIVDSLNKALNISKGTYIARMDADDVCHKDRLLIQVRFMDNNQDIGCCGSFIQILNTNKIVKHEPNPDKLHSKLLFESDISHPAAMIRKSVLIENNIKYNRFYEHAEDYRLWCEIAAKSKVANIDKVLLYYRLHSKSVSHMHIDAQKKSAYLIQNNLLEKLGLGETDGISIHSNISLQKYIYTTDYLKSIINWLELLKSQNSVYKIFPIKSFQEVINGKIKKIKDHFQIVMSLIETIKKNNNSVYIWGAGELGKRELDTLKHSDIKVSGFIDSNTMVQGRKLDNLSIYSPDYIFNKVENKFIFISSLYYKQIESILIENSFKKFENFLSLLELKEAHDNILTTEMAVENK